MLKKVKLAQRTLKRIMPMLSSRVFLKGVQGAKPLAPLQDNERSEEGLLKRAFNSNGNQH